MAIATGNVALAADVNAIGAHHVRKTADETVNNSEVLQNDDHLLLAVAANSTWHIFLLLKCSAANATPDLDFAFVLPGGASMRLLYHYASTPHQGFDATAEITLDLGAATEYYLTHLLYIGGGNAGNIQLQWAQHAAHASDTKILIGSCLICHDITSDI